MDFLPWDPSHRTDPHSFWLNVAVGRLELAVDRDDLAWTPDNFVRGAVEVPVRRA